MWDINKIFQYRKISKAVPAMTTRNHEEIDKMKIKDKEKIKKMEDSESGKI